MFESQSPPSNNAGTATGDPNKGDAGSSSRPKGIACVICRRKKLRCDGAKPSCGPCSRLNHDCAYDEVRKKRGPKRGHVKQLEARLAQAESLLRSQEPDSALPSAQTQENAFASAMPDEADAAMAYLPVQPDDWAGSISPLAGVRGHSQPTEEYLPGADLNHSDNFVWDMISLGLEEPLPIQDVIDELNQIYLEKIHPSIPIIHWPRYMAAMNLAHHMRPPICLQYIIWCYAASITDKYSFLQKHFYQRARKYAEMDDMKGCGEKIISVAHCQCWLLIGTYEFRMMYFPRAWLNVGKASRLALMMGLHHQDGVGLDVKRSIPPATDWTEREERRRTFWMAFCTDRYASLGNGWPMTIDERDIMSNLPATEEAFNKGQPEQNMPLAYLLAGDGVSSLSPFGGVILLACLLGRNVTHLHRPDPKDNDHDLRGEFWKRHRAYDSILLNIALSLPDHLRLPNGVRDPKVIYCNMFIHTSIICLHQAAIFKAEKNKIPDQVNESKRRCIVAADQISSIMKMISHTDLGAMNSIMWFCVFVSARVLIQHLKSEPNDLPIRSSLQFVLSALNALKHKSPLNESFLVQLEVDIEGTLARNGEIPLKTGFGSTHQNPALNLGAQDIVECSPLLAIRQSQSSSSGVVAESPMHDSAESTSHSSSDFHSSTQHMNSLTRQQKESALPYTSSDTSVNPGTTDMQGFATYIDNPSLGLENILDMEFSSEFTFSGNNTSSSDHPTPSMMNSCSNTSISNSKPNQPPPAKREQQLRISHTEEVSLNMIDGVNPSSLSPNGTEPFQFIDMSSLAAPYFAGGPEGSLLSTGSNDPISIPSARDHATAQSSNLENIDIASGNGNGLGQRSEAQWQDIPFAMGWESWRG